MSSNPRKRVHLLDDHPIVRCGLEAQLRRDPLLEIAGSHATSRALLVAMSQEPADVVITDFSLSSGEVDGLNLIRGLRSRFPKCKILVVSSHFNPATVSLALQAGAHGFIGKSQPSEELVTAIHTVLRGRIYLHSNMAAEIAGISLEADTPHTRPTGLLEQAKLSPREYEVLRCCLDGMSTNAIAAKFSRQANTVSTQKKAAFRKLGIRTTNELFKMSHLLEGDS